MKKEGSYTHVLKYTGLFGSVQGLTMLASVVRNKVVAVALGTVGMAFIDIYNHIGTLLSSLTTFGLSFSAVRSLSALRDEGNDAAIADHIGMLRGWSVLCALLGTLLCAVLSPLLSCLAFDTYEYTVEILCLSPMVGMLALTGMEIAILKALRQLRALAVATTASALWTLAVSVPAYAVWGRRAIVAVLLITTAGAMVSQMVFSLRLQKWNARPWDRKVLRSAGPIIRLGLAYVLAAGIGQLAEMGVRAFIVHSSGLRMEGLYCAMFTLTVSYGRFMFTTMDADYFPRLSAQTHDRRLMEQTCCRQTEVALMMMAPFLLLFALLLPLVVRLLLAEEFLAVVVPTACALMYMYFRAAVTPIAYMPLATGDGRVYFTMEAAYYVWFTLLVCAGYQLFGLAGAGVAMSLSTLIELVVLLIVYGKRYRVRLSRRTWRILGLQGVLLLAGIGTLLTVDSRALAVGAGVVLLLLQIGSSLMYFLRHRNE